MVEDGDVGSSAEEANHCSATSVRCALLRVSLKK